MRSCDGSGYTPNGNVSASAPPGSLGSGSGATARVSVHTHLSNSAGS